MSKRKAFITGINGQDGSYLAEYLLEKDYDVYGIVRRNSIAENQESRIDHLVGNGVHTEYGDLLDVSCLERLLGTIKPDEIYNIGAQSHVRISFDQPIYTAQTVAIGVMNLLEAIRLVCPKARMYQASSSEMFGNSIDEDGFQRETTPMNPVSPYGCAKVFAYNLVKNYRNSYGLFLSNGILFNHESPRRGTNFVTNKVAKEVCRIATGNSNQFKLGNLKASRDWGHAKDYVKAMWLILQHDTPDDFVCSTGISHTVEELVDYVFKKVGIVNWEQFVGQDEKFMRPEELNVLKGDCSKAKKVLGWKHEYTFETMMDEMVDYWLKYFRKQNG